jgi:hypothetical protein
MDEIIHIDSDTLEVLKKVHAIMNKEIPTPINITYDNVIYRLSKDFLSSRANW